MSKTQISLPPPAEALHAERPPPMPVSVPNNNLYPRSPPDIQIQPRQGSLARPSRRSDYDDDDDMAASKDKPKPAETFDVKDIQGIHY
jgi:hypothetical protein